MLLLLLDSLFIVTLFTGSYAFCVVATISSSSSSSSPSILKTSLLSTTLLLDTGNIDSLEGSSSSSSSSNNVEKKKKKHDSFPAIRSKVYRSFPTIDNLFSRLSYSWVNDLMKKGNSQVLELEDVWLLHESKQMNATSTKFDNILNQQRNVKTINSSSSSSLSKQRNNLFLLKDFWSSPITRAIVIMYQKQFMHTGLLRLANTLIQFLPSLIIARLLRNIEFSKITTTTAMPSSIKACMAAASSIWSMNSNGEDIINAIVHHSRCIFTNQGFQLSLLLFTVLTLKTAVENQYFDYITQLSADIRGTLSTAIYKKSLKLSPASRRSYTMGEIVNYMQIDTGRLEYAAGTIHTVWDGLLQIAGYTFLLLRFLGRHDDDDGDDDGDDDDDGDGDGDDGYFSFSSQTVYIPYTIRYSPALPLLLLLLFFHHS